MLLLKVFCVSKIFFISLNKNNEYYFCIFLAVITGLLSYYFEKIKEFSSLDKVKKSALYISETNKDIIIWYCVGSQVKKNIPLKFQNNIKGNLDAVLLPFQCRF